MQKATGSGRLNSRNGGQKRKSTAAAEREEAADDKAGAIQKGDGMAERILPYAPGQARGTPGEEPDCPEEEVRCEEGS